MYDCILCFQTINQMKFRRFTFLACPLLTIVKIAQSLRCQALIFMVIKVRESLKRNVYIAHIERGCRQLFHEIVPYICSTTIWKMFLSMSTDIADQTEHLKEKALGRTRIIRDQSACCSKARIYKACFVLFLFF